MSEFTFSENLLKNFRSWLCLNVESISWEGRYEGDFDEFWSLLFPAERTVSFLSQRLNLILGKARSGPLVTWFGWLRERFFIYCFLSTGLSLRELAKISQSSERSLALTLRDFFIERFPHKEEQINKWFHVGNLTSPSLYLKFEDISSSLELQEDFAGASAEDTLTSLEITLYPDWKEICRYLKNEEEHKNISKNKAERRSTFKRQLKFARELVLLFSSGRPFDSDH